RGGRIMKGNRRMAALSLSTTLLMNMVLSSVGWSAPPDPNTPPMPPAPIALPSESIVPGTSVGYLPASWNVKPTGQFIYSIPLDVPTGRAGMHPTLSLNYDSAAGNGLLGVGWSLGGLSSITRCARTLSTEGVVGGVRYSNFLADAESSRDRFCL